MLTINSVSIRQIGYGAMGLEGYYGQSEDNAAVETLIHAIDQNIRRVHGRYRSFSGSRPWFGDSSIAFRQSNEVV
jgi:hypothetical protein